MNKCGMESTDKVEIAKQAIKEIMEEHQLSEHKPTAKQLVLRLLSQVLYLYLFCSMCYYLCKTFMGFMGSDLHLNIFLLQELESLRRTRYRCSAALFALCTAQLSVKELFLL